MHYVYWKSDNSKSYNIALIISVCILISADEGLLDRRNFIENIKRILQESIYLHKKNIRNMKKKTSYISKRPLIREKTKKVLRSSTDRQLIKIDGTTL